MQLYKATGAMVQGYRCNGTRLQVQSNEGEGEMQEIAVDEVSGSQSLPTVFVQRGRLAADHS